VFWSGQKQNIRVDIHADDYRRILTEGAAISHSHFTRRIRFVLIKTNWTMLCSSGEKVWFVATELSLLVAPAFIQTLNPISRLVPMSSFISTACRNVSFAAILFQKQKNMCHTQLQMLSLIMPSSSFPLASLAPNTSFSRSKRTSDPNHHLRTQSRSNNSTLTGI